MAGNILQMLPAASRPTWEMANVLLQQGMRPEPVSSHLQGISKLAQAASGAYTQSRLAQDAQDASRQMAELIAGGDLSSPELMTQIGGLFGPEAALGLAQANRAYGLQEQEFGLDQAEAERQQAVYEQLFGGGSGGGDPGFDNPYAAAAAVGGDYAPAATAYQNTPGTYQPGTPGAVPMTELPDRDAAGGTLIPPEQPAERTPQMVGREVYETALGIYGADVIGRYRDGAGGMPGIDGNDPEEWALGLHVWLQQNNIDPAGGTRSLLDLAQGVPTGEAGPTPLAPPGFTPPPAAPSYGAPAAPQAAQAPQQPSGPRPGTATNRQTGEPLTTIGPDGREWYARMEGGMLVADTPVPTSPEERREVEGETFQRTQSLADDFRTETKDFQEIQRGYANIASAFESGAGDLAIIFSFMKMMDPGSTVREGEQATASNAPGVQGWVRDLYNDAVEGRAINPNRRAELIEQAQTLYQNARQQYDRTVEFYRGRAESFGIDPQLVIPDNLIDVNQTDINALIEDLYNRMPELPRPNYGGR